METTLDILDHEKITPFIISPNELVVLTPLHLNSEVGDAPTGDEAIGTLRRSPPCRLVCHRTAPR